MGSMLIIPSCKSKKPMFIECDGEPVRVLEDRQYDFIQTKESTIVKLHTELLTKASIEFEKRKELSEELSKVIGELESYRMILDIAFRKLQMYPCDKRERRQFDETVQKALKYSQTIDKKYVEPVTELINNSNISGSPVDEYIFIISKL